MAITLTEGALEYIEAIRDIRQEVFRKWISDEPFTLPCFIGDHRPSAIERTLRAPELCESLRTGVGRSIHDLLACEIAFSEGVYREDCWSALGDAWLGRRRPNVLGASWLLEDGNSWRTPILANTLPVDLSIGMQLKHPKATITSSLDQSLSTEVPVVAEALELLKSLKGSAFSLVSTMTSNLVLLADSRRPGLRSSSSPAAIGRLLLVNASSASLESIAEALVHESVHAAISSAELETPLVLPDAIQEPIESPWTGARLTFHAFAHAVFVWSTIRRFRRSCEQPDDDTIRTGYAKLRSTPSTQAKIEAGLTPEGRILVEHIIEDELCM